MDPVSLAASIITLISATTLTLSSLTRLWNLRGKPDYLCAAINEITDFQVALQLIRATVESPVQELEDDVKGELQRLLERAKAQINSLQLFLDGLLRVMGSKTGLTPRAKIQEVLGKNERRVHDLRTEIASIKASLTTALNVAGLRYMPRLHLNLQQIAVLQPASTSRSMTYMPTNTVQQTASIVESISSAHTPNTGSLRLSSGSRNSMVPGSSAPSHVMLEMKWSTPGRTCRQCPCQCHVPFQGGTPRWLSGLIGAMFFNSTGVPILNKRSCNVTTCGTTSTGPAFHFQYFFPTWLLARGVQITGQFKHLRGSGATWNLKIPRVINSVGICNDILGILMNRSILDLKEYFSSHAIGANDVFYDGWSIFEHAVMNDDIDAVLMLLDEGVSLDFQSYFQGTLGRCLWKCSIQYFTSSSYNAIIELPQVADYQDSLDFSALHKITTGLSNEDLSAQIGLDRALVNRSDCFGRTPLHWAILKKHVHAIDLLLDAGTNVNAQCNAGDSILHVAVQSGSLQLCERLLHMGAIPTATNFHRRNPLHEACLRPDADPAVVPLLLRYGLDINSGDIHKCTGLFHASRYSSVEICAALLENGAVIEAIDSNRWSPICYAILGNNLSNARLLIQKGAILNRMDYDNDTVIHCAAEYGGVQIIELLRDSRIKGLSMENEDLERYWQYFDTSRPMRFVGEREPLEVEKAAFQGLLDSVIPCDNTHSVDDDDRYDIPGTFPDC